MLGIEKRDGCALDHKALEAIRILVAQRVEVGVHLDFQSGMA